MNFIRWFSKWGHISSALTPAGVKLLFNEALKGVIGWGVAAWLFAVNRSFSPRCSNATTARSGGCFPARASPKLTENTDSGPALGELWMAPIIFTFLKQMSVPTWLIRMARFTP